MKARAEKWRLISYTRISNDGISSETWIRHTKAATAVIRTPDPFPLKSLPKS
jgi:hypothetical protein